MISDREVTFFLALGELLADIEQPKRLIEKKLDAFRKARGLTEEYVRRGIREDLVGVILKKKLALILIAKTADEVERAANPHRPQYDFGTWREDPFALPEEEFQTNTSLKRLRECRSTPLPENNYSSMKMTDAKSISPSEPLCV